MYIHLIVYFSATKAKEKDKIYMNNHLQRTPHAVHRKKETYLHVHVHVYECESTSATLNSSTLASMA